MQQAKVLVQMPVTLKAKLDALRAGGITTSGLIRRLLEEHFHPIPSAKKGR